MLPEHVKGITLLRFTTQMSLRDAVIFLLKEYPDAGYALGRGDAEKDEADAPFVKGAEHGTTRLSGVGPCTTTWLVATVTGPGASLGKIPQLKRHDDH